MSDPDPYAPPPKPGAIPTPEAPAGAPGPPGPPPTGGSPDARPAPTPPSPYSPTAGAPSGARTPPYAAPPYLTPPGSPGYGSVPPGYGAPAGGYGYGYTAYPATPTSSGRAVAVMVLGIVSLVGLCLYGVTVVCAIVALALAPGAKREIRASNGWRTGEGMVRAGVICSWICIALAVVGIIAVVAFAVALSNGPSSASATFGA